MSPIHQIKNTVADTVQSTVNTTVQTTANTTAAATRVTVSSARWVLGMSRHGMVAANRKAGPKTRAGFGQLASMLMGSTLIGLGVSLFVAADLGVPAFDVLFTAIRDLLGISLGQAGWLFTACLLLVATALGQPPRMSGLLFIFANGLAVDVFINLIRTPSDLWVRMGFVALGTLAIAAAVALILHAGLTGGSVELLMRAGEARGLNKFWVRTGIEAAVVGAGVALGGDLGPATLFFVVTMSPMLRVGQTALNDHRTGRMLRTSENDFQHALASISLDEAAPVEAN